MRSGKQPFVGKGRREQFWLVMDTFSVLSGFFTNREAFLVRRFPHRFAAVADDVACLAIVGALGAPARKRWEPLAAQLWFLNICINGLSLSFVN